VDLVTRGPTEIEKAGDRNRDRDRGDRDREGKRILTSYSYQCIGKRIYIIIQSKCISIVTFLHFALPCIVGGTGIALERIQHSCRVPRLG